MTERERNIRRKLRDIFPHYAVKCLRIRVKGGAIEPFVLNTAQNFLHGRLEEQRASTGRVRALVLKGRQQGVSTYMGGRYYWRTTHRKGCRTMLVAHKRDATSNLFDMVRRFHDHCPKPVKPRTKYSSKQELYFNLLDSGYALATAGTGAAGRSQTVQLFHGSEVAFWENCEDLLSGMFQTIPDMPDTEIVLESTANGLGNFFHGLWQDAEAGNSDFIPIFIPWFWQQEYRRAPAADFELTREEAEYMQLYGLTLPQMAWRRAKIIELRDPLLFKQEYPATPTEAFQTTGADSLIIVANVLRARRHVEVEPVGPVVCGVDPARFGADSSGIIFRRGRQAFGAQRRRKVDTMELAGLCRRILESEAPYVDRMFIDVGGLGAGVVDRLREMGFARRVTAVNFGSKAIREDRYVNKRAEMWGALRDWLADELPADIPDEDSLQADLVGPQYSYDSSGRLKLESKEDMKKRGIRSPDLADALALTFAAPVRRSRNTQKYADGTNHLAGRQMVAA